MRVEGQIGSAPLTNANAILEEAGDDPLLQQIDVPRTPPSPLAPGAQAEAVGERVHQRRLYSRPAGLRCLCCVEEVEASAQLTDDRCGEAGGLGHPATRRSACPEPVLVEGAPAVQGLQAKPSIPRADFLAAR